MGAGNGATVTSVARDITTVVASHGDTISGEEADGLITGLLPATIDETLDALFAADRAVAAAKETQRILRDHLASLIGDGGAYRDHTDMIYRSQPARPRRMVTPGSERALLEWLGADLVMAVPASAVRVSSVRGIAERRYRQQAPMSEAMGAGFDDRIREHVEAVEGTFYTWADDPADTGLSLTILPVVKAPKYLQALAAGASYVPAGVKRETGETDE